MALTRDDLVLCAGTLAATPLLERASVAAAAGFRGLSLFLDDRLRAHADGHGDAELRQALADQGLEIAELDPLLDWVPDTRTPGAGRGFLAHREADFYAAAEALGARSINAALFVPEPVPEERLVEAFAALCDRARDHGLLVHLEFMPFSQIRDIDRALAIVEGAGRANGGIMFDAWHHFRSGGDAASLRRAASRVLAIQLDDAPARAEVNPVEETMHRRLFPGEGDADVPALMRALDAGGCTAPVGIEVFRDDLAEEPPAAVAQRAADSTRRVLAAARGPAGAARGAAPS